MPIVLQTRSSLNLFKRKFNGKLISYSQQATSIEKNNNESSKQLNENSQLQPTTSKEDRHRASPVIETQGKKAKNNDDSVTQLEKSDEEDLELQRNSRQTNENSDDAPPGSIYKKKSSYRVNFVQASGSTPGGSTIVCYAPAHIQSNSEDEDVEKNQYEELQECTRNGDSSLAPFLDEIRNLKMKNTKLLNENKELSQKHDLIFQKHQKLIKKMANKKHNMIPKPPPVVVNWMSNIIQQTKKHRENVIPTPAQCLTIIKDAATVLKVAPEQLKSCKRECLRQTARRLTFLIWPDPTTRGRIDAKTVCREKLQLIHDVCKALHPDVEPDTIAMNTAIYNVCSSTRVTSKKKSNKSDVSQHIEDNDVDLSRHTTDESGSFDPETEENQEYD